MNTLSPRQQAILNRIIDLYIDSAQPVGSKQITELFTRLYHSSYSPATVRNEMGALEELGYLTHPHTSAGRMPTDLGYRYYVDYSLREELPPADTLKKVAADLMKAAHEAELLAEKFSAALSVLSGQVGIVTVAVGGGKPRRKVFVQGTSCLFDEPEFSRPGLLKSIFKVLEDHESLQACLEKTETRSRISISIGGENKAPELKPCSVLASHYVSGGSCEGTLALMGPRRMRYSRLVPLVARMSALMENILEEGESQ